MEFDDGMMTFKRVCSIIKLGRTYGVSKIQLGAVCIEFSGVQESRIQLDAPKVKISAEKQKEMADLRREETIEQIKLIDPLMYEQMLASGDIEDITDEEEP